MSIKYSFFSIFNSTIVVWALSKTNNRGMPPFESLYRAAFDGATDCEVTFLIKASILSITWQWPVCVFTGQVPRKLWSDHEKPSSVYAARLWTSRTLKCFPPNCKFDLSSFIFTLFNSRKEFCLHCIALLVSKVKIKNIYIRNKKYVLNLSIPLLASGVSFHFLLYPSNISTRVKFLSLRRRLFSV